MMLNLASFYIAWWGIVYMTYNRYYLGLPLILILHLIIHFKYSVKVVKPEILTILVISTTGVLFDLIFNYFNFFVLKNNYLLWIPIVWIVFSTTINHSFLKVLNLNTLILFLLGFVFGPISYWSVSKFDLLIYSNELIKIFSHALFWGIFLILIKLFKGRYEKN